MALLCLWPLLPIEKFFADAQIGVANFHGQVRCQVVHQAIAQLRIGFTEHDEFVARNNQQARIFVFCFGGQKAGSLTETLKKRGRTGT